METKWTTNGALLANIHQAKKLGRSYPAEVESCMANLVRVLSMLDGGVPLGTFRFSFLRPEGGGIYRIGQTGVDAAREMRLYVAFDESTRTAYLLGIGTKNTQQRDIAAARQQARRIGKESP